MAHFVHWATSGRPYITNIIGSDDFAPFSKLQHINLPPLSAAYMHQWTGSALVQVKAWCLFGTKPLPEPVLAFCQLDSWEQLPVKFELEFYHFRSRKCLPKWRPLGPGGAELINSLWPRDAIRQHRFGSTLAQVMACCLTAPSRNWTNVDWSSVKSSEIHLRAIPYEILQPLITKISMKITYLKFLQNLPGANELTNIFCGYSWWLMVICTC